MAKGPKIIIGDTLFGGKFSVSSDPPTLAAGYREFPTHAAALKAAEILAHGNGYELADLTGGAL